MFSVVVVVVVACIGGGTRNYTRRRSIGESVKSAVERERMGDTERKTEREKETMNEPNKK